MLSVFGAAAAQDNAEVARLAFEIVEQLVTQRYALLVGDFVHLMNCLNSFASSMHTPLSLRALQHLAKCADSLAGGDVPLGGVAAPVAASGGVPTDDDGEAGSGGEGDDAAALPPAVAGKAPREINDDDSVFRLWFPLLLGLSVRVADARLPVRLKALDTLHGILQKHGALFSAQAWGVLLKGVLLPMMDSAKTDNSPLPSTCWPSSPPSAPFDRNSWVGSAGGAVLGLLVEMYARYREQGRTSALLPELLRVLCEYLEQDTECLARLAAEALHTLLTAHVHGPQELEAILSAVLASMTRCLVCSFGDAGSMHAEFSDALRAQQLSYLYSGCPLQRRRRREGGEDASGAPHAVSTPFGPGVAVERLADCGFASERLLVRLSWGVLYTSSSPPSSSSSSSSASPERLAQVSGGAMTCLVVLQLLVPLVRAALHEHRAALSADLVRRAVAVLEAVYWHAHNFN
eukprot:gene43315-52945_t